MDYYKIFWKNLAKKELKSLDKKVIARLIEAVEALASNPYPTDCLKLVGSQSTYRLLSKAKDLP